MQAVAHVDGNSNGRARLNTRVTRQRMGRLTDTKVRGFMVTETNNDACAQLQPVLAHAASLTLQPSPPERLAPSCWAVGLFLSIAIKLNSGRMNLRSASKSTPDPPDACSKERAQTPPLTRNAKEYTQRYIPSLRVEYKCQNKTIYILIWKMIKKLHTE